MAFDALVVANLAYELKINLLGGRISKISMPDKDELIFTIKNNSNSYKLLISVSASLPLVYLTSQNKQSPAVAPAFCMLLRKHLNSGRLIDIYQDNLERILIFVFEHLDELGDICKKKLIVELMGKHSNIILTDFDNNIIDSIKRISAQTSSLREVLPGRSYFLPKELIKNNFYTTDFDTFTKLIKSKDLTISKSLYMTFSGLSPLTADDICIRSGFNSELSIKELNDDELKHLYNILTFFFDDIKENKFVPNIIYNDELPVDFSSFIIKSYDNKDYIIKKYDNISSLLYDFYSIKDNYLRIRQKSTDLRKIVSTSLERSIKKYDLQEKQLLDSEKRNIYKVYGDLLNTYGYELQGGEKSFTCLNFYDDNKEITIPLDENLSANENAKKYYDKYSKLRRTALALNEEIIKTKEDILHLQSIMTSLDLALTVDDLNQIREELVEFSYLKRSPASKKVKLISKPLHFISSDGFHIYVGKNNYQNEELTFKLALGADWWFHAKGVAGSHVIVKSDNKELPDKTFEEAAALAAFYSKNKDNNKVDVDYIQRKNIKKVPASPPGFVVYHTNWSMTVTPSNSLLEVK